MLGTVYTPFPETTDFSSFLIQAKASGAKVIGLANSGDNTVNCIKQAQEFGITKSGVRLASLLLTIPDVHATGIATAQGLVLSEAFYWDMNANTRAWSKRFGARMNGVMPNMIQAGDYSAVTHYLKVVKAMGVAKMRESGRGVIEAMKATPTDDVVYGKGIIRADGRKIHPMYLFQVKSPSRAISLGLLQGPGRGRARGRGSRWIFHGKLRRINSRCSRSANRSITHAKRPPL